MKNKVYTHVYECKKCNKTLYYLSNKEYSTVCKTCGQDLTFVLSRPYNPKNNIRRATKRTTVPQRAPSNPTITCPYCKSTNCKKISGLSKVGSIALWGVFALGKATKQWHCNNCKSDF